MTVEEKARAYDKTLEIIREMLSCGLDAIEIKPLKLALQSVFPELNVSDDEITRESLISFLETPFVLENIANEKVDSWIAWFEKQGESDKSLYIRFGDIPINGKSKVYNGEIETGIEEGISVYPAFEDKEGNIILGLNLPITKTSLHTQQHLLEYESRPCYLVTGDYVGKGTDGEPLIKNVRIIKEIKPYRIKQDKVDNQNYVKSADKVEPKFKVGDWITDGDINIFQITKIDIDNEWYYADDGDRVCFDVVHDYYSLVI